MIRKWLARHAPLCAIMGVFAAIMVGLFYEDCSYVAKKIAGQVWAHQDDATVPPQFGKTHFIVGQPAEQRDEIVARKSAKPLVVRKSEIFFSPDDDVRSYLLKLIDQEQESIAIAVFVFTDKHIAHHLIEAAKRGVHVEVVTDSAGLRDRYNKIGMLCDAHIPIFVYNAQHGKAGLPSLMHNKFVIFNKNNNNQSCVWTGSCNFTRSACESNQENAIVLTEDACTQRFTQQFQELKKRSYRYEKNMKV